jgi:plastocyanin
MRRFYPLFLCILGWSMVLVGCQKQQKADSGAPAGAAATPVYFKVNPASAGSIKGAIHFVGGRPKAKVIDMSGDPACVLAHKVRAYDESLLVGPGGGLADAFVYVKKGLEGKTFEVPTAQVTIDQRGCWFHPRVLGVQIGQVLQVINSDEVTHNIHPMAVENREWNHSQGPGDAPLIRKFTKPEVMIPVKCNIHSWMHAFIGVVDNPYFAVSKPDGTFEIPNLPAGTYTLAVWHDGMAAQEQEITVTSHNAAAAAFKFKGE